MYVSRNKSDCPVTFCNLLTDQVDGQLYHLEEKARQLTTRLCLHDCHLESLKLITHEIRKISMTPKQEALIIPLSKESHRSSFRTVNKDELEHTVTEEDGNDSIECSHRQLLKNLGYPAQYNSTYRSIQDMLDDFIGDRSGQVKQLSKYVDDMINLSLTPCLDSTFHSTQLILEGLLQDSPYQSVHLLNERLRSRISNLEMEVNKIGSNMEALQLDQLSMPCKERDNFVNQWDG